VTPGSPGGLTYAGVGGTLTDPPVVPPGFSGIDRRLRIGAGRERFEQAAAAVLDWQVQRRAGIRVDVDGPVAVGRETRLGIGFGPLRLHAPCRVVAVVQEPGRRGFAYGTLRGHPEAGEEAFLVETDPHDPTAAVFLHVVAFSRHATRLAKFGGPVSRWVQRAATTRYLRALGT
jgi:uncharacterized protein (UPF0548 family)